jgi:signal transduction histidine kinase
LSIKLHVNIMKLKRKIMIALLFLFSISAVITGVAAYNTLKLARYSDAILKNNYNSVVYAKDMLKSASETIDTISFKAALNRQLGNITENGEKELSDSIAYEFQALKAGRVNPDFNLKILLYRLMEMNMKAIEQKNNKAQEIARQVIIYLIITGLLFCMVAIVFIIRFPSYIALPVIKRDIDKTNLIATVSHELKTPAASIKLGAKLLEDQRIGSLNPEQKALVNNIKEETERLLKITEVVLNMAQLETGNIQLNIQMTDPKEIVGYAIEAVSFQASQHNNTLRVVYSEYIPMVKADIEKTTWVMINLLLNAIRYSPEGKEIIIEAQEVNDKIEFSVQDFGKGIKEEYKNQIFNKYFQIPGSSSGTGLGLAISKEFIEAQGGNIRVESEPGKGSKFIFSL